MEKHGSSLGVTLTGGLAEAVTPRAGAALLVDLYREACIEAAARRALKFKTCSYRSMKAILSVGLDRQPDNGEQHGLPGLLLHQNIRGQEYYR